MVSRLGRLNPSRSVLLLCDLQEKFAKNIKHFDAIVETSGKVADVARVLSVPSIITEQYPKGLGHTVPQLKVKAPDAHVFHKTMFSMCSEQLIHHIQEKSPDYQSVILCGIEAQACILETCLDFLELGKDVHIVVDAVSSRSLVDRKYAFNRMQQSGAFLTTSESIVFQLCKNAAHPKFKDIQKLIIHSSPDSGLLDL